MDSTTLLNQIEVSQAQKEVMANENFAAASPAMMYARDAVTSSLLTWGYTGGRYNSTAIANGTVTLAASTNNYVVSNRSTGAVSTATSTTNWNDSTNYTRLYKVVTSGTAASSWEDHRQTAAVSAATTIQCIPIAVSDETTAITTGTGKVTFRMPFAFSLTDVRGSLTTAQTSGSIFTVDVNESGTTILSTKLTIDNTEKTSTTAATALVISDIALADDAEITIDVDQVGDGTAKGLKVYLIGTKV